MASSNPSSSASSSASSSPSTSREALHLFASRLEPPPRPPPLRLKASFPSQPKTIPEHLTYPSVFTRPFADPHETLCTVYGVRMITLEVPPGGALPDTVDMPRLASPRAGAGPSVDPRSAPTPTPTPTHVLAVLEVPTPSTTTSALRPLLVPVNAELLAACFRNDFVRSLQWPAVPSANAPPPPPSLRAEPAPADVLRLPVRPLYVPHPPSVPLLLLFGFGDDFLAQCAAAEAALRAPDTPPPPMSPQSPDSSASITPMQSPTRAVSDEARSPTTATPDARRRASSSATLMPAPTSPTPASPPQSPARPDTLCAGLLATYLLPLAAIEEFPATPAMAQQCSSDGGDGGGADGARLTSGLWRNVLLLAPREQAVIEIAGTAMRVAWEAGRV